MDLDKNTVKKTIKSGEVRHALHAYMTEKGYRPVGNSVQIPMTFRGPGGEDMSVREIEFTVEDPNNPAPTKVTVTREEADEIIARAKKVDLKTHFIEIDLY